MSDQEHERIAVYKGRPLHDKLWNVDGSWTGYVTVLLNSRSVQYLRGLATLLADGDTHALFPPVGGR